MFYQINHPATSDYFRVERGEDFSFPSHMHGCFELVMSLRGEIEVIIDGSSYMLSRGEAVLIFPNQIHSLRSVENEHILLIFSPRLVGEYYKRIKGRVPVHNKFVPPMDTVESMLRAERGSIFCKKGFLYSLCDLYDCEAEYRSAIKDEELLTKVFLFIEHNYMGECSLEALSRAIGYNYSYLSRAFKAAIGLSFKEYVNIYRLDHACMLLTSTDTKIIECALESGFRTVNSFNRNFKERYGISPNEYRKGSLKI